MRIITIENGECVAEEKDIFLTPDDGETDVYMPDDDTIVVVKKSRGNQKYTQKFIEEQYDKLAKLPRDELVSLYEQEVSRVHAITKKTPKSDIINDILERRFPLHKRASL